ncbi:hypothetical protein HDV03_005292 [Kappamyces sp. JEL0829]|nr:hypothetical protein HDV03_005292 [Kappamyces sp. JEL0829]
MTNHRKEEHAHEHLSKRDLHEIERAIDASVREQRHHEHALRKELEEANEKDILRENAKDHSVL